MSLCREVQEAYLTPRGDGFPVRIGRLSLVVRACDEMQSDDEVDAMESPMRRTPLRRRLGFEQVRRMAGAAFHDLPAAAPERPLRVLEAGVGHGQLLAHLLNHRPISGDGTRPVEYWGFDITDTSPAVDLLRQLQPETPWNQRIRRSSPNRWPFEDAQFDLVVSNQVIEHVTDLPQFLNECRRVLRDDGLAIHVFPSQRMVIESHLFIPFVHWLQSDHARLVLLRILYRLRLSKSGWRSPRDAAADVLYLRSETRYRKLKDIARDAQSAGLRSVPRRTLGYLRGAFQLGATEFASIGPRRRTLRDRISAAVAQRLFSVTLVMWPEDAPGRLDPRSGR